MLPLAHVALPDLSINILTVRPVADARYSLNGMRKAVAILRNIA